MKRTTSSMFENSSENPNENLERIVRFKENDGSPFNG
jgi:hypothetical protein